MYKKTALIFLTLTTLTSISPISRATPLEMVSLQVGRTEAKDRSPFATCALNQTFSSVLKNLKLVFVGCSRMEPTDLYCLGPADPAVTSAEASIYFVAESKKSDDIGFYRLTFSTPPEMTWSYKFSDDLEYYPTAPAVTDDVVLTKTLKVGATEDFPDAISFKITSCR